MTDKIKIEPPNESGSTQVIIRWQCDMRAGLWIGAWEREAFAEFERLIREDEREKIIQSIPGGDICDPQAICDMIRAQK